MSSFIQIIGQISRLPRSTTLRTKGCASLEMTTKWNPVRHPTCSTIVEDSLQISSFMQNKANFRKSQVNVNLYITRNYENKSDWTLGENKPNTKPIQTQSNPIAESVKLMQSVYLQRIMKEMTFSQFRKTKPIQTQFKPKQSQSQKQKSEDRSQTTEGRRLTTEGRRQKAED
ncbi:MAG: hypothetical protein ACYTBX_17345 [Planctomycetota bacterium]